MNQIVKIILSICLLCGSATAGAQSVDTATMASVWSFQRCLEHALSHNIDVQKAGINTQIDEQSLIQRRGQRFPSLSASVGQGFDWGRNRRSDGSYGNYTTSASTNVSISSSVTLFNAFKINNNIKLARLSLQASQYDEIQAREALNLSVLNAYLQVIYAREMLLTSREQITSTEEQLTVADERIKVGLLAKADYLEIVAQLASEKLTLANAESNYSLAKLNLMQLMELPLSPDFEIVYPDMEASLAEVAIFDATEVYATALRIKPQIKAAALAEEMADLSIKIARADYFPRLSLSGSIGTGYSNGLDVGFGDQFVNGISPRLSLSLSIPIFQQNQVRTAVAIAKLRSQTTNLDAQSIRNDLRKAVEQACLDANGALTEYIASQQQFAAMRESYSVATEKFAVGLINSSDFLLQKTRYITAESDLLQSKYNLVFSRKIVEFYQGLAIDL